MAVGSYDRVASAARARSSFERQLRDLARDCAPNLTDRQVDGIVSLLRSQHQRLSAKASANARRRSAATRQLLRDLSKELAS